MAGLLHIYDRHKSFIHEIYSVVTILRGLERNT